MSADAGRISVEVVYALPDRQPLRSLTLAEGASVADAVQASGLLEEHPELNDTALPWRERVGVFGRQCAPDTLLRDGDRVELYRPLTMDPKEARRQRAAAGRDD
jgi:putative ubiquitin-RnfH superfamily antitoxin RatB of RatAB toxin-antitoxin module